MRIPKARSDATAIARSSARGIRRSPAREAQRRSVALTASWANPQQGQSVADWDHRDLDALVGGQLLVERPDGDGALVVNGCISHAAAPQDVVDGDQPAGPH